MMLMKLLRLSLVVLLCQSALVLSEEEKPVISLAELWKIDAICGFRMVVYPKGERSPFGARTVVSLDAEKWKAIEAALRETKTNQRHQGKPLGYPKELRNLVLRNSDGREIPVTMRDDFILVDHFPVGPLPGLIKTLQAVEKEDDDRRQALGKLPVIDATVIHSPGTRLGTMGSDNIGEGFTVRIDLNEMVSVNEDVEPFLRFANPKDPDGHNWGIGLYSAMSIQRLSYMEGNEVKTAGYRLIGAGGDGRYYIAIHVREFQDEDDPLVHVVSITYMSSDVPGGTILLNDRKK
jgi:hypothetical protein